MQNRQCKKLFCLHFFLLVLPGCYKCLSQPPTFVSIAEQPVKASLNRPRALWECVGEGKAALGCTGDRVAQMRSDVIAATLRRATQRSSYHRHVFPRLLKRAGRSFDELEDASIHKIQNLYDGEDVSGEPEKMIQIGIKNSTKFQHNSPNIIENDIATDLEENLFRLSLRWDLFPQKRWTNGTVYYRIRKEDYSIRDLQLIESTMKTFQFLSCIKFRPWDGDKNKDYLHIMNSTERPGCWSYIGRRGGEQTLSIRPPDEKSCHCLCNVGRFMHEMMHALGFYHEHTRPDRDRYIEILKDNVKRGKWKNFEKKTFDTTTSDFAYDYNSIMHYGPLFFSKDKSGKKTTIVPLSDSTAKIGQRNMLSKVDCMKVNQAFGCFDKANKWINSKIQILCGMMGV